ncbi:hypothetical protein SAMN02745166_02979 [Prosthecobacter debontii]|uniref:Uncharacterized protein n=1 Tax=Prosthecobacter debontii TaxID=48467 RepID=A0A1T4YCT5_9BACT|nr:hypothetical protein SAMN02745166_02979 [Prosthecobacter debontii]
MDTISVYELFIASSQAWADAHSVFDLYHLDLLERSAARRRRRHARRVRSRSLGLLPLHFSSSFCIAFMITGSTSGATLLARSLVS